MSKMKNKLNIRLIIGSSLTTMMFILTLSASKWSSFTQLDLLEDIEIQGAHFIPEDDYKSSMVKLLGTSIHDIDTREMSLLLESHPFVHASRISTKFPNRISVEIMERTPVALLNMDPVLFIDADGVVLPELGNVHDRIVPIMSGFNSARELYPIGHQSVSQKVIESVELIDYIIQNFPKLYNNLSEVTLNGNDEFVLILSDYPTKVILGKTDFQDKIKILNSFEQALPETKGLDHFTLLDLRYNRQVIARIRA